MESPLEEIEFLARSANRIEILDTLSESACTRRELGEAVEASQPTIGRVLNDLRARNWLTYDGERYRASATGRLVAAGITDLRERLETEARLREVVVWLPADAIDVDLGAFADATITTPTETRPNAPIERMLDLLRETDEARLLSHSFNRQKLRLLHDRATEGTLSARGVFAADAIDAIAADAQLRAELETVLDAQDVAIRVADEAIPVAVEITDDRTHLLLRDEDGIVRASIDTDDASVREWAETTHAAYWERSTPLDAVGLDG